MTETNTTAMTQDDIASLGLSGDALTDEGAATLRQLLLAMKEADIDQFPDSQSPPVARVRSIVRLLWGTTGEKQLADPSATNDDAAAANDATESLQGAEVADGSGFMAMSLTTLTPNQLRVRLRHAFATGRCNRNAVIRMSLAAPQRVRSFLANAEAVPVGTYRDGAELSEVHAKRIVDRMFHRR